jgi:hypothetical protein
MAEDYPSRLVLERVLITFYKDLPKRSKIWQASISSIKDLAAKNKNGC